MSSSCFCCCFSSCCMRSTSCCFCTCFSFHCTHPETQLPGANWIDLLSASRPFCSVVTAAFCDSILVRHSSAESFPAGGGVAIPSLEAFAAGPDAASAGAECSTSSSLMTRGFLDVCPLFVCVSLDCCFSW